MILGIAFISGNALFFSHEYQKYKDIEIQEDTIFALTLRVIIRYFSDKKISRQDKILNAQYFQNKDNPIIMHSAQNMLFSEIIDSIEQKFNEIKKLNIIKFLLFVDSYLSEEIWLQKIKEIIINKFKNFYEKNFIENLDIFKIKITNNNLEDHLNNYNELFDNFLKQCIIDINNLGNKKEYNEKTGLNCLEHLIMNLNPEVITEDIANQTVNFMLYFKLVTPDGIINKKLFEDCFVRKQDKKEVKLNQTFNINIINKIDPQFGSENISNLNEFIIYGFEIPMIDSSFVDLYNFYNEKKYNTQEQLKKDYALYIINNFKAIINNMLIMNDSIFESYYQILLKLIKTLIQNLIQKKIFISQNQRSFENIISSDLSNEEREEFNKIMGEAGQKIKEMIK